MTAGRPRPMAEIMSELLARRGYAQERSWQIIEAAWRSAAGEALANHTRATRLRRGVLEVLVDNSVLVQELSYRKAVLLADLARHLPKHPLSDLKFRVGPVNKH